MHIRNPLYLNRLNIFIALLVLFCPETKVCAQQPVSVLFKHKIKSVTGDTGYIMRLIHTAKAQERGMQTDSALANFQEALAKSRDKHYNDGIAYALIGIGHCSITKGDYEKSDYYFQQALPYCMQAVFNKDLPALLYNNLGIEYTLQGKYPEAADYYYKSLNEFKTKGLKNTYLLAIVYNNIGGLWMRQNQNDKALYYLKTGEQIAIDNGQEMVLAYIYGTIGGVYSQKNDIAQDRYYSVRGMALSLKYNDIEALQSSAINLGNSYENDSPQKALQYFETAIYYSKSNPHFAKVIPYIGMGETYFSIGDYAHAEETLQNAIAVAGGLKMDDALKEARKMLSKVYAAKGMYKEALEQQMEYTQLADSLFGAKQATLISQLDAKYRTAEKDKEIIQNNLKITQQKSIIREKNLWIYGVSFSAILLATLLISLYTNNRHRQRLQTEKIRNLQQEQDILHQEQEIGQLKAMINGEEKERERLARELHDGIVAELSAVKMNFNVLRGRYKVLEYADDYTEAIQQLENTAMELRKTAHNLMPEILLEQGLAEAVHAFCEKMSISSALHVDFHLSGYIPRLDPAFELSLYRMIQELIQNIIKHANASAALVQLDSHEPQLIITIEDNGQGMDKEKIDTNPGTGLRNIIARVKALQGQLDLYSSKEKGTSINIEFDTTHMKNTEAAWT